MPEAVLPGENSLSGILHRKHSLRCCGDKKRGYLAFQKGKRASGELKQGRRRQKEHRSGYSV